MGDVRFGPPFERIRDAVDALAELRKFEDEDVVQALAGATQSGDPLLVNVLATEAMNRMRRATTALRHLAEGTYMVDIEGRILDVNPAAERLLGWTRSEVRGADAFEIITLRGAGGAAIPREEWPLWTAMNEGRTLSGEVTISSQAGSSFAALYTWAPVTREGLVTGAVLTFRDISDRKAVEQKLAASERRMRAVLDSALDAVITIDAEGRVRGWNTAAERTFGHPKEDAIGQELAALIVPERFRAAHRKGIQRWGASRDGPILGQRLELAGVRRDGTEIPVELTVLPVTDDGRTSFTAFLRDLTDRNRTRQRILAQNAAADVIAKAVSVEDMLPPFLEAVTDALGWRAATFWRVDPGGILLQYVAGWSREVPDFVIESGGLTFPRGAGLPGRAWSSRRLQSIADLRNAPVPRAALASRLGLRTGVAVPILLDRDVVAVLEFFDTREHDVDDELATTLNSISSLLSQFLERKRAEARVVESERRFRATFEQAAVGLAHVAPDGRWLLVNDRLCEITGRSREDLMALTYQDITHPDDVRLDEQLAERLLRGEFPQYSLEKRYVRGDGSPVWVEITVSLLRDERGAPERFITAVQDISRRRGAEEALAAARVERR